MFEIETMAVLDHFCLLKIVGFTIQKPYRIATEYMPRGSLDTILFGVRGRRCG
jgi:hypothetical protein